MKRLIILTLSQIIGALQLFGQAGIQGDSKDTLKYQLGQITVSATRYPENILEIPYAVSILTREQLQNIKGYGIDEALSTIPGVLAQSRTGNQDVRIVIRGFGARGAGDRSNSGTSRGLRIMLDGIPETEPDGRTSLDNIDLTLADNVEVIRSNSSALWGNAGGGIINISSIPSFETPFISLGGIVGSYGFQKFTLQSGTNLGVGKLSISVSNTIYDGWRQHSGSKRTIVNVGLISKLSDRTKLGVYLVGTGNLFHISGPLTKEQFDNDPKQSNPTYLSRDERRYNRLGRFGVTLDHALDNVNEFSAMAYVNPKYLQRSERGTFRDFTRYHVGGNFLYRNNAELNDKIKNQLTLGIVWRTYSGGNPKTKYFYVNTAVVTELTTAGNYTYFVAPEFPLPVELSTFEATLEGRNIKLFWETKTEINSNKYEVERSIVNSTNNGLRAWNKIGEVSASGTSTVEREYTFVDNKLQSGKYIYRLKMVDNDGTYEYSKEVESEVALPKDYAISQNYPNPFNPTTRIDYQLPFDSKVTLDLYGITGERIATLINGELTAGYYTTDVNASALNLASGVYIYRMTAQNPIAQTFVQVKKLMLTK